MSNLELNKIAASILVAGLVAMVVGNFADILYRPTEVHIDESSESASDVGGASAAPEAPIDIKTLFASADAEKGQKTAKLCLACHTLEKGGADKVGPNLWNIVGAKRAHRGAAFAYSKALMGLGGNWTDEELAAFLHKPSKYLPGTKMSFAGVSKPQDLVNLLAYLHTLNDSPKPLK